PRSRLLTRVLLVFDVFLPKLLFQLRIGFLLRCLPQTPRDDVIVAAVGNRRRRRAIALRTTAAVPAVALLALLVGLQVPRACLAVAVLAVLPRGLGIRAAGLQAAVTLAVRVGIVIAALVAVRAAVAGIRRRARVALLSGFLLPFPDLLVERAERVIELAMDGR